MCGVSLVTLQSVKGLSLVIPDGSATAACVWGEDDEEPLDPVSGLYLQ